MRYNHIDMLPEGAFQKEFRSMKLYGGGGGSKQPPAPKPYDPTQEKDYIESASYLATLKDAMAKNNVQLTPEQIIAALSNSQREIIASQKSPNADIKTNWGNLSRFSNIAPNESSTTIIPQFAPQPTGSFSGVKSIDPNVLSNLQAMLSNSNYLPTVKGGK